jgi:hypothetical protein
LRIELRTPAIAARILGGEFARIVEDGPDEVDPRVGA